MRTVVARFSIAYYAYRGERTSEVACGWKDPTNSTGHNVGIR